MSDEEGLLGRWSRRKRAIAAAEEPQSDPDPARADRSPAPEAAEDEPELLARLGLPVPETLQEGDDFAAFLASDVPEFLRRRALRVLWRSNPVLANLDGLNDYDDDFTSPELTQKVLATGYQVGRGFIRQVAADDLEEVDPAPEEIAAAEAVEEPAPNDSEAANPRSAKIVEAADEEAPPERPRRMRFRVQS